MKRIVTILAALVLALAAPAVAQVQSGEASLNLSATIAAGYTNDTSNLGGSDHSIFGAGIADFSGSYYHPNFLSFDVQPFYNQSRFNSSYQSMTAASGVGASAKIFSGSEYPGSISYYNTFNSTGNFGIPGLANYTTHGDSDVLVLSWGIHHDDLPSLHLNFADANSTYSVYGADTTGRTHSDTFSVNSSYKVAGFNLNGGYQYNGSDTLTPEFLTSELPQQNNSSTNAFSFGLGHNLPGNGGFSATATRLDISANYGASTSTEVYHTSIDTLTSSLTFSPRPHLMVGGVAYYTDNLEGTLFNTLLAAGVIAPGSASEMSSHDLSLSGIGSYQIPAHHLDFHAFFERQEQTFLGASLASDSINGSGSYSNRLWGGQFNGMLGLTETFVATSHQSLLGLNTTLNYIHPIHNWNVAGGFSYSQDTQTVLINYTTSGYTYSGNVGRKVRRRSYCAVYASGARSLLTDQPGTANSSQSYGASFSLPRFTLNGSYSTSSGNSLLTSTGLVSTPVPVTVLPSSAVVLYNGRAYSLGLGSDPVHGLTLSASFTKSLSSTNSNATLSNNNNDYFFALLIYHFRKLDFQSGYSRLVQGFSVATTPAAREGSFYIGVSRWFNFF